MPFNLSNIFSSRNFKLFCLVALLSGSTFVYLKNNSTPQPLEANITNGEVHFFAVGRQGYDNKITQTIANSMEKLASQRKNVGFTILLGDNFYPEGVESTNDPQWEQKFEQRYKGQYQLAMPFFAILGNHDHQGNVEAQIQYSKEKLGTARWTLDAPFYSRDFGEVDGRPLVRIVFLDSVLLNGVGTKNTFKEDVITRDEQIQFIRRSFSESKNKPHWRVIVSHYSFRSATQIPFSKKRVMSDLLPILKEENVDLVISANDRFQQVIDLPGEPLHVSTNGGGERFEEISDSHSSSTVTFAQHGFGAFLITPTTLTIELYNHNGRLTHTTSIGQSQESDN
jgi:acid phosphatase/tartrate-resistant acid phosphatase type 5